VVAVLVAVSVRVVISKMVENAVETAVVVVAVNTVEAARVAVYVTVWVCVSVCVPLPGLEPPPPFLRLSLCCAPANKPMKTELMRRRTRTSTRRTLVRPVRGSRTASEMRWETERWPWVSPSLSWSPLLVIRGAASVGCYVSCRPRGNGIWQLAMVVTTSGRLWWIARHVWQR